MMWHKDKDPKYTFRKQIDWFLTYWFTQPVKNLQLGTNVKHIPVMTLDLHSLSLEKGPDLIPYYWLTDWLTDWLTN
jgi:hypothetical protein